MPFRLTGFADEISPDLGLQVSTLKDLGIGGLDLRSVDGKNVLDLRQDELQRVLDAVHEAGISVSCIGSPVNKIPYDVLSEAGELERLRKACQAAAYVNCDRVRLFPRRSPRTSTRRWRPRSSNGWPGNGGSPRSTG